MRQGAILGLAVLVVALTGCGGGGGGTVPVTSETWTLYALSASLDGQKNDPANSGRAGTLVLADNGQFSYVASNSGGTTTGTGTWSHPGGGADVLLTYSNGDAPDLLRSSGTDLYGVSTLNGQPIWLWFHRT